MAATGYGLRPVVGPAGDPDWSPDGSTIVFTSKRDGNREIYRMGASGENPVRLTTNPAADYRPAWAPDGQAIAFVSDRDGNPKIYVMKTGETPPIRLTDNGVVDSDPAWSPDGTRIAFRARATEFAVSG